jgi:hypothetical protein
MDLTVCLDQCQPQLAAVEAAQDQKVAATQERQAALAAGVGTVMQVAAPEALAQPVKAITVDLVLLATHTVPEAVEEKVGVVAAVTVEAEVLVLLLLFQELHYFTPVVAVAVAKTVALAAADRV